MRDRTGQVWRKDSALASDIIVIASTEEAQMLGTRTGQTLTKGTNHVIIRFLFREWTFEHQTWYEPDTDRWEDRVDFMRTV
jgi:hypothetical protein